MLDREVPTAWTPSRLGTRVWPPIGLSFRPRPRRGSHDIVARTPWQPVSLPTEPTKPAAWEGAFPLHVLRFHRRRCINR